MTVSETSETDAPGVRTAPPTPGRGGAARALHGAAPSLVWLAVRLVGLLVLQWLSAVNGERLRGRLVLWDGQWLLNIAGNGYDRVSPSLVDAFGRRTPETPLAFFPGYPLLVGLTRFVTGTGLVTAGLLVSLVAGLVLAHGLTRLGSLVPGGSRRAGLLLTALVAAAPMGVVWSMTYSEGLFCACAAWALVALLRRDWVLAGWCTALAGVVRPTAAALLAAVGLAALVAVLRRRDAWRPWAAALLAPLGLLGYLWFVASRTGSPLGWFILQRRGWNSEFDGGAATLRFAADVLATGRSVLEVGTVVVLAGSILLCVRRGMPWPLWVYAAGVIIMDLGANGLMNSKARLLLPAFTLLVPVAVTLSRRRPTHALALVAAVTLASAWFGGYALTAWHYAI